MKQSEEVQAEIDASGLSVTEFAHTIMGRDARTVRRWISGESRVPAEAMSFLRRVQSVRVTATSVVIDVTR